MYNSTEVSNILNGFRSRIRSDSWHFISAIIFGIVSIWWSTPQEKAPSAVILRNCELEDCQERKGAGWWFACRCPTSSVTWCRDGQRRSYWALGARYYYPWLQNFQLDHIILVWLELGCYVSWCLLNLRYISGIPKSTESASNLLQRSWRPRSRSEDVEVDRHGGQRNLRSDHVHLDGHQVSPGHHPRRRRMWNLWIDGWTVQSISGSISGSIWVWLNDAICICMLYTHVYAICCCPLFVIWNRTKTEMMIDDCSSYRSG